jgi:hypothetical protein
VSDGLSCKGKGSLEPGAKVRVQRGKVVKTLNGFHDLKHDEHDVVGCVVNHHEVRVELG